MTNKKTADKDISYEQAMERLQKILAAMENGDMTLEESISAYETAVGLYSSAALCWMRRTDALRCLRSRRTAKLRCSR